MQAASGWDFAEEGCRDGSELECKYIYLPANSQGWGFGLNNHSFLVIGFEVCMCSLMKDMGPGRRTSGPLRGILKCT